MKKLFHFTFAVTALLFLSGNASPQKHDEPQKKPEFNAELARKLGANEYGMRQYVFVLLKTGSKTIEDAKERSEIFAGHFANMNKLAEEGKLVMAGPFDQVDGWRGMFIYKTDSIDEAKKWTETDPVIKSGLMVAEYHILLGSAALLEVNRIHKTIAEKDF